MRKQVLLLAVAGVLMLAGCVPTKEPLVELKKAKADKNLVGKWKGDSGDITIAPAEQSLVKKGLPKGFLKLTRDGETYYFVSAGVGKDTYGCVVFLGKKQHKGKKVGALTLNAVDNPKLFVSYRYTLKRDTLTIEDDIDMDVVKAASKNGELDTKGLLTSSLDDVKKFLVKHRKDLFTTKQTYQRVKPSK